MKKFFAEFKTFVARGNVLDMAVGVIVGGAFTAIVNAMSNNILRPIINWLLALVLGKNSLSGILTFLGEPAMKLASDGVTMEIDLANSFYIDWGAFINAIINFLLIAFVLFAIVKIMNRLAQARNDIKKDAKFKRDAIKKYRKEGLKRKEAIERYTADLEAEAAKIEAEAKAAEEAAANVEKEMDVLKDIRDLLKAQAQSIAE